MDPTGTVASVVEHNICLKCLCHICSDAVREIVHVMVLYFFVLIYRNVRAKYDRVNLRACACSRSLH